MHERGYQAAAVGGPKPPADTITHKAVRIEQMAGLVLGKLYDIHQRAVSPADSDAGVPEPGVPDHAVFALESTERKLEQALKIAQSVLDAL